MKQLRSQLSCRDVNIFVNIFCSVPVIFKYVSFFPFLFFLFVCWEEVFIKRNNINKIKNEYNFLTVDRANKWHRWIKASSMTVDNHRQLSVAKIAYRTFEVVKKSFQKSTIWISSQQEFCPRNILQMLSTGYKNSIKRFISNLKDYCSEIK